MSVYECKYTEIRSVCFTYGCHLLIGVALTMIILLVCDDTALCSCLKLSFVNNI